MCCRVSSHEIFTTPSYSFTIGNTSKTQMRALMVVLTIVDKFTTIDVHLLLFLSPLPNHKPK